MVRFLLDGKAYGPSKIYGPAWHVNFLTPKNDIIIKGLILLVKKFAIAQFIMDQ